MQDVTSLEFCYAEEERLGYGQIWDMFCSDCKFLQTFIVGGITK